MGKRKRRHFSPEYKAEVVALVREGERSGKSVGQIAKEMDLTETSVRAWVKAAEDRPVSAGKEPPPTARELELMKENKLLRMERDILKKAAAFFAKEST